MRKLTAIACACTCFVAAGVPTALAGGQKYEGDFSGSGTVSFKVEKRQDGKKVVNYRFRDFPVDCGGTPKLTSGHLEFAVSVSKKEFRTKAVAGNPTAPESSLILKGELRKGKAEGTLRVYGPEVNVGGDPPERDECESGKTNWNAAR